MPPKPPEKSAPVEGESVQRYRAPALEKGLDILELLSSSGGAMTTSQIASKLGKSVSELFRMLQVLEHRGYIVTEETGGFALTDKLFALGLARAPMKSLVSAALPVMESLAQKVGQSCHLVVASGDQIVVIARIESPGDLGFSVRVGYRRHVVEATSGLVLYGFQPAEAQAQWRDRLAEATSPDRLAAFLKQAEATARQGHAMAQSDFVQGVTDISAPILGRRGALAALTVPYLFRTALPYDCAETAKFVKASAQVIADALAGS